MTLRSQETSTAGDVCTFYVWADDTCHNATTDLCEAMEWARELRHQGNTDVYVEDDAHVIQRPHCVFCDAEAVLAVFTAAQSEDQGRTVTLIDICAEHAEGWNDGSDWTAPLYPICSIDDHQE